MVSNKLTLKYLIATSLFTRLMPVIMGGFVSWFSNPLYLVLGLAFSLLLNYYGHKWRKELPKIDR